MKASYPSKLLDSMQRPNNDVPDLEVTMKDSEQTEKTGSLDWRGMTLVESSIRIYLSSYVEDTRPRWRPDP